MKGTAVKEGKERQLGEKGEKGQRLEKDGRGRGQEGKERRR